MKELPKIGKLRLENPFFLAPMDGVNSASFRLLCRKRGASLIYTGLIHADGIVELNKQLGEEEAIKKLINPVKEEKPLAIQLVGKNIDNLKESVNIIEKYADLIDFNAGCPSTNVLANKEGAFFSKHPEQMYKVLSKLREEVKLPFTVKIRSGWDSNSINAVEVAKEIENIGLDGLAIHPRTRKQMYSDKADWKLVKEIKEKVNIPVILSGDVFNVPLTKKAFEVTNTDFIMLGRAARVNPSLFTQVNDFWSKDEMKIPGKTYGKEYVDPVKDYLEYLEYYKTLENRYSVSELRDHSLWTAVECKNVKEIKRNLMQCQTEEEIVKIIKEMEFFI